MRRIILTVAVLAAFPCIAHAKNAAGSSGAAHQGASHHAHAQARGGSSHTRGGNSVVVRGQTFVVVGRTEPAQDAHGRIISVAPHANQGLAPETREALASKSSETRYRGELCQMLATWSDQRVCLAH